MSKVFDETGAGVYLGGQDNPISPRTMQRLRQTGEGPEFMRPGGVIRYTEEALDAYRESRTFRSTSEGDFRKRGRGSRMAT